VKTPTTIAAVGAPTLVPTPNATWDPTAAPLTPEEYFVLTRVDGRSSLKQIWSMTGFSEEKTAGILQKLREAGAILFPGDSPKPRQAVPEAVQDPGSGRFAFDPQTYNGPPIDAAALLEEQIDLTDAQKRSILHKFEVLRGGNLFDILGVDASADKKDLKRAYFKISKEFHPDRFYGRNLGSFKDKLAIIFERATHAFDYLSDDSKRAKYLGEIGSGSPGHQTPKEHGAELFKHAVQLEIDRDVPAALKMFAAAVRIDPQPRYLRRAAEACLRAQELRSAEEYAKKAAELDPRDAGAHRTLAKVLRAIGRPGDARKELEIAIRLEPGNAHIAQELEELSKPGGS
jgi:tetratricopeptide (TPR) repeat protein